MFIEGLKCRRVATELVRDCKELMRQATDRWNSELHGSGRLADHTEQNDFAVDLLTAIEQASEAPLHIWAESAHAGGSSREQFLSAVREETAPRLADAIEQYFTEAVSGGIFVNSELSRCTTLDRHTISVKGGESLKCQPSQHQSSYVEIDEVQRGWIRGFAKLLLEELAAKAFDSIATEAAAPALAEFGEPRPPVSEPDMHTLDKGGPTTEVSRSFSGSQEPERSPAFGRDNETAPAEPLQTRPIHDPFARWESRCGIVADATKQYGSTRKLAEEMDVQPKHLYEWRKTRNVATKMRPSRVPGKIEDWFKKWIKERNLC